MHSCAIDRQLCIAQDLTLTFIWHYRLVAQAKLNQRLVHSFSEAAAVYPQLSDRARTHKALWAANFLGSTSIFTFHFEATMGCSNIIESAGYTDLVIGKLTRIDRCARQRWNG
jgi:hypothetical protein